MAYVTFERLLRYNDIRIRASYIESEQHQCRYNGIIVTTMTSREKKINISRIINNLKN